MRTLYWIPALLLLSGCTSSGLLLREYTLTAVTPAADQLDVANTKSERAKNVAVGIGPVEFPRYLQRPHIVVREGNLLRPSDNHQWGGDLESDFTRVLAANLASRIPSDRVSSFLWADPRQLNYRVSVQVTRFERDAPDSVLLVAHWLVLPGRGGRALHVGRSSVREWSRDAGYPATVDAMSAAVAALSREIADAIRGL